MSLIEIKQAQALYKCHECGNSEPCYLLRYITKYTAPPEACVFKIRATLESKWELLNKETINEELYT